MKKKIYRIKVALTVIFFISCIGYMQNSSSKNLINANSKQIITLNPDTPYSYELPTPSSDLYELELKEKTELEGFVQTPSLTTVINLDTTSEKGEYISGRQFYGNSNASILKGNTPGFIISDNSFGAPNPDSLPARTSSMFIIPDSNGNYSEIYSLLSDTVYDVDGNFNNTPSDGTFSPAVFEGENNGNIVLFSSSNGSYMKKIDTDTYPTKPTKAVKTDFGSYTSQTIYYKSLDFRTKDIFLYGRTKYSETKLKAFKLDIDNNTIVQELDFEKPNLTYAYNQMISYNLNPETFFSEIGRMTSFKDGSYFGQVFMGDSSGKALYQYLVHWDSSGNIIEMTDPNNSGIVSTSFIDYNLKSDTLNFSYSENGGSYTHYSSITGGDFSTIKNLIDYSKSNTFSVKTANINSEIKYSFSGNIAAPSDPKVAGYSSGFVFGFMDSNFKIVSASTISKNLTYFYADTYTVNSNVYIAGAFQGDKDFLTIPPIGGWKNGTGIRSFFGKLGLYTDYPPAINAGKYSIVNKDDLNEKNTDELLINGLDNRYPVKVYDTVDGYDDKTIENLKKRINRNPRSIGLPIDWSVLGFNTDKVGPNNGTYFVSDTQLLTTTTTRTVNIIDSHTKYDETVASALHAQNFAIKLVDLQGMQDSGGLTAAALTEAGTTDSYGHVLAWNLNTGDNLNAQVQVDAKELAIINGAKGFGQYPLTYTLKDEQGNLLLTKDGTLLKRETIVYVLDKNSQVVGEKGNTTVFNTEDFTLPWDNLQELKADKDPQTLLNKIKSEGKVIAYDFDTGEEIPSADIAPVSDDVESLKLLEPSNKVGATDAQKKPTQAIHYTIKRNTETEEEISLTTTTYTTVTVIYRFATVTLAVKDEESQALYDLSDQERTIPAVTITNQIVGKTLDFTTEQAISDAKEVATIIPKTETEPAKSTGYEFDGYYDANNTTPLTNSTSVLIKYKATDAQTDPNLYTMRFKGLLYLNVPETMSFGTEKIRAFTQTVKPEKDNTALIVGDHRKVGTVKDTDKKGQWKVTVKLASDFVQEGENAPTLENILYYNDVLVPKNEAIMIQTTKKGSTKTEIPLNDTSSFRLKIPTGTAVTGKYQGSLTWNVLNAP